MARSRFFGKLHWRRSRDTGYYQLEDDRYGYATVARSSYKPGKWYSNMAEGLFPTAKAAKKASERTIGVRLR